MFTSESGVEAAKSRFGNLTAAERKEIASAAAKARWKKTPIEQAREMLAKLVPLVRRCGHGCEGPILALQKIDVWLDILQRRRRRGRQPAKYEAESEGTHEHHLFCNCDRRLPRGSQSCSCEKCEAFAAESIAKAKAGWAGQDESAEQPVDGDPPLVDKAQSSGDPMPF